MKTIKLQGTKKQFKEFCKLSIVHKVLSMGYADNIRLLIIETTPACKIEFKILKQNKKFNPNKESYRLKKLMSHNEHLKMRIKELEKANRLLSNENIRLIDKAGKTINNSEEETFGLEKAYELLKNDTYKIHYKYLKFKNLITCEKDCGKLEISPDEKICLSCGSGLKLKS